MITTKVQPRERWGMNEAPNFVRSGFLETRTRVTTRKPTTIWSRSSETRTALPVEASLSDVAAEPLNKDVSPTELRKAKERDVPEALRKLPESLFSEGSESELLMMYNSNVMKGNLDSALFLIKRFVQADRHDVLKRVIRKHFLKQAAKKKSVRIAIDYVEALPKEYVDPRTYSMLATLCVHAHDLENALLTADLMKKRGLNLDLHMYTNLISAYGTRGKVDEAFQLYRDMKAAGIAPDCKVASALANVCSRKIKSHNPDRRASLVLLERASSVLADIQAMGRSPDLPLWNVLVTCAGRAGHLDRAFNLINEMKLKGCPADDVTYTALVDACVKNGRRDLGLKFYKIAIKELPKPTVKLFTVALEACMCGPSPANSKMAFEIYRDAENSGLGLDIHFFSTMIRLAGKSGMPQLAVSIEENMKLRGYNQSKETCSALISAAISSGDLKLATKIYSSMTATNIYPDHHQFTNLMLASAKAHRFGDMVRFMEDMLNIGMQPDDVITDILLNSFKDSTMADLGFAVFTLLKGRGVRVSERVCYAMLDICHIQVKYLRGVQWKKPGHNAISITEGMALLKTLSQGSPVPAVVPASTSTWVDRAISVYKSALTKGVIPSMRLLSKLICCLRIPSDTRKEEEKDITSFDPYGSMDEDILNYRVTRRPAETCFDKRVVQVINEAITSKLLPPLYIDCDKEVDMEFMPPSVAEAYIFTLLETIKFRFQDRGHYRYGLVLNVAPFDPRKALLPSKVWKADRTSARVVNEGEGREETSLAVVATLRRLGLWHSTEQDMGVIYISDRDIINWMKEDNVDTYSQRDNKVKKRFTAKLIRQQRDIRLMNETDSD